MSIRKETIYLSTEVYRWLWMLAKVKVSPDNGRIVTPDEIADQLLRKIIREGYPALEDYQKKIDELEKRFIESMKTP